MKAVGRRILCMRYGVRADLSYLADCHYFTTQPHSIIVL